MMNDNDNSGEVTPFSYASSNPINATGPTSNLLDSESSKKQPNNNQVEQKANDDDQSNGNKQGSSAEDGWPCGKCNKNNVTSDRRCQGCLEWKDGQGPPQDGFSLHTKKKSKSSHDDNTSTPDNLSVSTAVSSASAIGQSKLINNEVKLPPSSKNNNLLCSLNNSSSSSLGRKRTIAKSLEDGISSSPMESGGRGPSIGCFGGLGAGSPTKSSFRRTSIQHAVLSATPKRGSCSKVSTLENSNRALFKDDAAVDENAAGAKALSKTRWNNKKTKHSFLPSSSLGSAVDRPSKDFSVDELSSFAHMLDLGNFGDNAAEDDYGKDFTISYQPTPNDLNIPDDNTLQLVRRARSEMANLAQYGLEPVSEYAHLLPSELSHLRDCYRILLANRNALVAQFGHMKPWDINPLDPRWWKVLSVLNQLFEFECLRCGSKHVMKAQASKYLIKHQSNCSQSLEPELCEHCGQNNEQLGLSKGNQMVHHKIACSSTAEMREEFEKKLPILRLFYSDNKTGPEAGGKLNISYRKKGIPVGGRTYRKKGSAVTWKYGSGRGESIHLDKLYHWARARTLGCGTNRYLPPGDMRDRMISLGFTQERGFFGGLWFSV